MEEFIVNVIKMEKLNKLLWTNVDVYRYITKHI